MLRGGANNRSLRQARHGKWLKSPPSGGTGSCHKGLTSYSLDQIVAKWDFRCVTSCWHLVNLTNAQWKTKIGADSLLDIGEWKPAARIGPFLVH
jgi:hypothetical protein